jgi:hypothetical protein
MVFAKGWGEERIGISVWEDEQVLALDGGDSYTTMELYLISQNCTLKKMLNFMLCTCYHA